MALQPECHRFPRIFSEGSSARLASLDTDPEVIMEGVEQQGKTPLLSEVDGLAGAGLAKKVKVSIKSTFSCVN